MERPIGNEGGEHPPVTSHAELEALPVPRSIGFDFGYLSLVPPGGDSWDEWVIERGVAAALRERRSIDDRTARYIASQLHEGQTSALYSLASTGAIDETSIYDELRHGSGELPEQVRAWARWLSGYCALRPDTGPVTGWGERAAAADRAELETLRRNQAIQELDSMFGEQPDEETGTVDELGWFGLVRHDGRPGGLVLTQDEQGFRHVWETDSDDELDQRWSEITDEYERFYQDLERGQTER